MYGLLAVMGQYPGEFQAWITQNNNSWMAFQNHFIKAQQDLRELQQTLCQGGYCYNNLESIKEAFANIAQAIAEDRVVVTNLNGANMNLTYQVAEYANHMTTKNSSMENMKKTVSQMQG